MKKPREFWILNMLHSNHRGRVTGFDDQENADECISSQPDVILSKTHVIEYSAYKKAIDLLDRAISSGVQSDPAQASRIKELEGRLESAAKCLQRCHSRLQIRQIRDSLGIDPWPLYVEQTLRELGELNE